MANRINKHLISSVPFETLPVLIVHALETLPVLIVHVSFLLSALHQCVERNQAI